MVPSSNLRLIVDFTKRDFKMKYLGSVFGLYWNIIHPVVMIAVYTLVFSRLMGARLGADDPYSYSLYLCSALLPWNAFAECVNRSVSAPLENASFLKKMPFPTYVLFVSVFLTALLNFAITFSIYVVFLIVLGKLQASMLPLYLCVVALFGLFGMFLGMGLGCLNVFLRDFQQLTGIVFQLWFWFTPLVYLSTNLPEFARDLLMFNPAFGFVESLHQLLYFGALPEAKLWLLMLASLTGAFLFGWFVYKRSDHAMRDEL